MSAGDVASRMRAIVDQHTDSGPYVPRVAAGQIVEKLRANDPEFLADWLDEQAPHFVWQLINDRDRSRRGHATHTVKSAAFRDAAQAADAGDTAPLHRFLDMPLTVADGTRRRLADLHRADLEFVAAGYRDRERHNGMRAAFMTALARKVGAGAVGDQFTEDQLAGMWTSLAA